MAWSDTTGAVERFRLVLEPLGKYVSAPSRWLAAMNRRRAERGTEPNQEPEAMAANGPEWTGDIAADSTDPMGDMMRAARGAFITAAVFSFIVNMSILVMPFYMFSVFRRVIPTESLSTLGYLIMVVVWVLGISVLVDIARAIVLARVGHWIDKQIGPRLFDMSIRRSIPRGSSADMSLLSKMHGLRSFISSPSVFIAMDAPWVPVFVLVLFLMNFYIGLTALVVVLIAFGLAIGNRMATDRMLEEASKAAGRAEIIASMGVRNADTMEALGMTSRVIRLWRKSNNGALELQAAASRRSGIFQAFVKMMRIGSMAAVMTVAATQMFDPESRMAPGIMMASMLLVGRCIMPLEFLVNSYESIVSAFESFKFLRQSIKADTNRWLEAITPPNPTGRVDVTNVVYHPPEATRAILNRIRFTLQPGESLGIVGPTASGKSSLARLLTGIEPPTAGDVRLDGTMLHSWPTEDRGKHIGYLPQSVELMDGTIRQNVSRFETDVDDEAVWRAIDLVGARDLVESFPGGLDFEVGENGGFLSGGQRQRIGLARAVFGDVKVVILDEPNANLDTVGEKALGEGLLRLKEQGVTVVVILHRPNILSYVDYIMVMRDGGIQKFAPRDEMLPLIGAISRTVGEEEKPRRIEAGEGGQEKETKRIDAGS